MNPVVILLWVFSVAISSGFSYYKGYEDKSTKCQVEVASIKETQQAQYLKQQDEFRKKERDWVLSAEKARVENMREINQINARHSAVVNSLRNRPERAKDFKPGLPETPSACSGVSGAELARGDGEFLAGYAADAKKVEQALQQCINQYNEIAK